MYIEATPVVGGGFAQLSQTEKIRRKIGYEKVVKSTDHINAYVNLTNFEYEGNEMNGNGNHLNLLELTWKKIVKSLQLNLFLAALNT